jgi:FkbM family methyltransferase
MDKHTDSKAFITYGTTKFLDVFHARALANEIFDEDCYNFARIPAETIVLDIGACYGEFAIRCAVEKRSRVIAYEPSSENRAILEQNRKLNDLTDDNFVVSSLAIGTPGRRTFMHRPEHPAGSMFETEAKKHGCTGNNYEVEVAALADQIRIAKERWGNLPICLKMDCEGAEHEIFANYADWIDQVQVIAMEWHDYDGVHFKSLIEPRGFTVLVEGGGPKPRPLWDPSNDRWTWKGEPWGSIGAGLLFAVRKGEG